MAKKKSKLTSHDKEKLIKAQHEKEFLTKLRTSFMTVTGEDLFKYIPPTNYRLIISARARPIIAVADEGESIPSGIIRSIQELTTWYVKNVKIAIEATQKSISIADFYTLSISLLAYFQYIKFEKNKTKFDDEIRRIVDNSCLEYSQQYIILHKKMNALLFPFLSQSSNKYWLGYYSYKFRVASEKTSSVPQYQVLVKYYQPEKKNFSLSNGVRPAFRIGWTFRDDIFQWSSLLPSQLGMQPNTENEQIPVYIQVHAIERLLERIDCICEDILIECIYYSLSDCNFIPDKDKFLIEFKISQVKVGYLSAVLTDGKLLIRTFLFITFNGTPEGKRLEDFIGLKMLDTKYLKMDKLSSFMTGKLSENEELRSIFQKADCLHLVELYDKLDRFSDIHPQKSPVEMLARYLEKERVD